MFHRGLHVSRPPALLERALSHARPSKWRALAMLMMVGLFNYIDRLSLSILQVPIAKEFALSDTQLGALTGLAFSLVYTIASVPIARIADRYSRKMLIVVALLVWTLMTMACGLATGFVSLLVLRMGVAIGEAGCVPATYSMISDYFPPQQRGRAIALYGMVFPLGTLLGFSASGWLGQWLGWRETFFIIGFLGLAVVPLVSTTLAEPTRGLTDGRHVESAPVPFATAVRILWHTPALKHIVLGVGVLAYPLNAILVWNAAFYSRTYALALGEIAFNLAFISGVAGAAGLYLSGAIADKLGASNRKWYLLLPAGASIVLVPFLLWQYHFAASAHHSFAIAAGTAVLLNSFLAPLTAISQSLVPSNLRAFTSAYVVCSAGFFGTVLGPFCTGYIADTLASHGVGQESLQYAILASGVVAICGAGVLIVGSRRLD